MALASLSIKRHNHRIHPCESSRKQDLLKYLIELHQDKTILLISKNNRTTTQIKEKNLTLTSDEELASLGAKQWDMLISFEVPLDTQTYIQRLNHVSILAVILVDESERQALYPIETYLGRTIVEEIIPGFEPDHLKSANEQARSRRTYSVNKTIDTLKRPWEKESKAPLKRFGAKKPLGSKKPWEKQKSTATFQSTQSKRAPRTFTVKSLKPNDEN